VDDGPSFHAAAAQAPASKITNERTNAALFTVLSLFHIKDDYS
jgi:hypothetical protein